MADPGSIVGVVALALQVFQGLSAYYSHFKAHDDDIVNSLRRIERVQGTLSALEGPLKSLELDNDVISEQVRLSIAACVEAVSQLEEMAKKCKSQTAPDNLHEKIRHIRDRALFPLRKGTLEDLARCLDRFQGNLDTVIQALELDVLIRIDERDKRQSAALMYQTRTIRRHQGYQTELLESIQDSSVQGLNSMSTISDQLQDMQKQLVLLAPLTSQWQNGQAISPSVLREGIESYSELKSTSRKIASKARRHCRCPRIDSPRAHARGFLSVFWRQQNSHDKTCPLYQKNHQVGFLGARLEFYRQFFVHVVEFQVTCSRGAGGSTIASTLRYRNCFSNPQANAVFNLLQDVNLAIIKDSLEFRDLFTSLKKDILRCFDSGIASPTDMHGNGSTFIHVSITSVSSSRRSNAP
ncbi:hypothetical protein BS50DRAFT_361253 [Corynespora cassiicola Philippines]|uniref:Fungal N-terminal domain-containing protein n=1 Tax=Corynespora cassiicola Philippines TaxID=1448308 RepID=A0A2T2NSI5_CORCC|nr:hypothetical protein BS50DRAFT_361253 [Corynespora cassiicola Philippines]